MKSTTLDAFSPTVSVPYHLSPYPDSLLDDLQTPEGNPAVEYERYESVQLAFLDAMQLLPHAREPFFFCTTWLDSRWRMLLTCSRQLLRA
jgi:hypothetical protein